MICAPITETTIKKAAAAMKEASKIADVVELRIDYINRLNEHSLAKLLKNKKGKVIVTNRKKSEGGNSNSSEEKRIGLLKKAIELNADFVDIEYSTDKRQIGYIIKNKKQTKIICSFHDFKKTPDNLSGIYEKIKKTGCDIVKIATFANSITDNFKIFELLKKKDKPTIAMCMGELGEISRILNQKYGSFLTFASLKKWKESAPGQIPIGEMVDLYRIKKINKDTKVFGVIGNPVGHSMSPLIHNTAFERLNLNCVYVKLKVDNLSLFMEHFREYFNGASVTIPYKQEVMEYLNTISDTAMKIGAVNTIMNENGKLVGYNTDCEGAMKALKSKTNLNNKRIIVLGAGGAARALCYGLKKEKAKIIILNRSIKRAKALAKELKCSFGSLNQIKNIDFDILINATSVGMWPKANESPVDKNHLKNKVVFDLVYNPIETKLIREAKKENSETISGIEMLKNQAALQFKIWTGKEYPEGAL